MRYQNKDERCYALEAELAMAKQQIEELKAARNRMDDSLHQQGLEQFAIQQESEAAKQRIAELECWNSNLHSQLIIARSDERRKVAEEIAEYVDEYPGDHCYLGNDIRAKYLP